jgi:aspartokinase
MITVPEAVEQIIRKTSFLEEALASGVANYSALARYIQPQVEKHVKKKVTRGAIIMALRRMESVKEWPYNKQVPFSKPPDITVRSNLVEFTVPNSTLFGNEYKELFDAASVHQGNFLTMSQGVFETTIVCSKEIQETFQSIFKKDTIISSHENLSAISIKLEKTMPNTPGVYYYILKLLAWEKIAISESISTIYEFTIILNDGDVERAFSVLKNNLGK